MDPQKVKELFIKYANKKEINQAMKNFKSLFDIKSKNTLQLLSDLQEKKRVIPTNVSKIFKIPKV